MDSVRSEEDRGVRQQGGISAGAGVVQFVAVVVAWMFVYSTLQFSLASSKCLISSTGNVVQGGGYMRPCKSHQPTAQASNNPVHTCIKDKLQSIAADHRSTTELTRRGALNFDSYAQRVSTAESWLGMIIHYPSFMRD